MIFESPVNEIESNVDAGLAPWAVKHSRSGGRIFMEDSHPYRTSFQRDRDRIIHSKAFRRLGYKTQVFVNSEGDIFRTRLTHSMEVAQISRSVTTYLKLNSDYSEALALAHDVGHSPFGHAGQDALNRLMKNAGGFEHNCQTMRILSELESRYIEWAGLNLCRLTLYGLLKHAKIYAEDHALGEICEYRKTHSPPLEASIVDICDRIAYIHHDFEDGLDSGFLDRDEVISLIPFKETDAALRKKYAGYEASRFPLRGRTIVRRLLNECITDLIETTARNIQALSLNSTEDVFNISREAYPVSNSIAMKERMASMQKFLYERLYRHESVLRMSRRGEKIIEILVREYAARPEMMPEHFHSRIERDGVMRVVSDYVSGMTDRFAEKEAAYLGASESVQ